MKGEFSNGWLWKQETTIKEQLKRKDFLILLLCFCLTLLLERLREKEIRNGLGTVVRTSESVVQEGKRETFLSRIAKVERGRLRRALTSGPRALSIEEPKSF